MPVFQSCFQRVHLQVENHKQAMTASCEVPSQYDHGLKFFILLHAELLKRSFVLVVIWLSPTVQLWTAPVSQVLLP